MKHLVGVYSHRHIALYFFVFFLMLFSMLPVMPANSGENNIDDKVVSLTVKNEPLGEVLKKISVANGCEFDLDYEWQNHPITVDLEKVPLNQALKQILKDLNHVIVYDSDQKIKIIIYGKAVPADVSSVPSKDESSIGTAESELPALEDVEKEKTSGTKETPSDDNAVSDGKSKIHAPLNKRKERHSTKNLDNE